jgi:hypothetical protein
MRADCLDQLVVIAKKLDTESCCPMKTQRGPARNFDNPLRDERRQAEPWYAYPAK